MSEEFSVVDMRMAHHFGQLRQCSLGISAFGILFVIAGCGSQTSDSVSLDPAPERPGVAIAPAIEPSAQPPFSESMVPSQTSTVPPKLPTPQLIPPTSSSSQVAALAASPGRSDPFAPLPPTNIVVTARPASSAPLLPTVPILPTAPAAPLPSVSVSALPAPAPLDAPSQSLPVQKPLAETIEISGFLDVGGAASLIVFVPGELTSRPARVGEYLGNGDVLIKRIIPQPSGDVLVILEQDGLEYQRTVGSNPPALVGSL